MLELFFGDLHRRLRHGHVLVALDGESGNEFENRLYVQRRAVLDGQLGHLRLAHGLDAQVEHRLVETLGQKPVDHFLANLVGIAALDDGLRHFAGAEAGNLGMFPVIADHSAVGLADFFGGNVQH